MHFENEGQRGAAFQALLGIHVCEWTIYRYGKALLISELFRKEVSLGSPHFFFPVSQTPLSHTESPPLLKNCFVELPEERKMSPDSETNNPKGGWSWPSNWVKNPGDPGKERSVQRLPEDSAALKPQGGTLLSGLGAQLETIWTWPFSKFMSVWMEGSDSDKSLLSDSLLEDRAASWLCKALLDVHLCLNIPCFLPLLSSMPVCIWLLFQT